MKAPSYDILRLKYGNTNTFYIKTGTGGLLIDTDYSGTLRAFFSEIKANGLSVKDISHVLATHYHPDHIGLIGQLQSYGTRLIVADTQIGMLNSSDYIFLRDRHSAYVPVDETRAQIVSCGQSREFLCSLGIAGEFISTPSHSEDSISLLLDNGDCIVGDLEPYEYLAGYQHNDNLEADWFNILGRKPHRIFYAHANEKIIQLSSNA